eukprot:1031035-Rhodomonas_salina.4
MRSRLSRFCLPHNVNATWSCQTPDARRVVVGLLAPSDVQDAVSEPVHQVQSRRPQGLLRSIWGNEIACKRPSAGFRLESLLKFWGRTLVSQSDGQNASQAEHARRNEALGLHST